MRQLLEDSEDDKAHEARLLAEKKESEKWLSVGPNEPVLSGKLLKKNRYGNRQVREFHLYTNGTIKYNEEGKKIASSGTMNLQ